MIKRQIFKKLLFTALLSFAVQTIRMDRAEAVVGLAFSSSPVAIAGGVASLVGHVVAIPTLLACAVTPCGDPLRVVFYVGAVAAIGGLIVLDQDNVHFTFQEPTDEMIRIIGLTNSEVEAYSSDLPIIQAISESEWLNDFSKSELDESELKNFMNESLQPETLSSLDKIGKYILNMQ